MTRESNDPTAHAEIIALRNACTVVGSDRLIGCSLYVTLEPCPMCAGAIVNCRIDRVVFGASDPKYGAAGGAMNLLQHDGLNHTSSITSGVGEKQCSTVLREFFAEQRTKKAEKY